MLGDDEIEAFRREVFVVIREAVPRDVIDACADTVWKALAAQGIDRADPTTWKAPVVRLPCPASPPFVEAGAAAVLTDAYDQLIGVGRWTRPYGIGGTVPVRFPSEVDPGDAGWHIDAGWEENGQYRVSVDSRGRALLALFLLTDIDAESAPTLLRPGSHHDIPQLLIDGGPNGVDWLAAAKAADAASAHRPVVPATGHAGDVFLCHPFLVHAASWPHRGTHARMLAQPAIAFAQP